MYFTLKFIFLLLFSVHQVGRGFIVRQRALHPQQDQRLPVSLRMNGVDGELPRWHNRKNVPEFVRQQLEDRSLSSQQLNRAYNPSMKELDRITRSSLSKGFVGAVFSLESCLLDLSALYTAALSLLAEELGFPQPAVADVKDALGNPFRDIVSALRWPIPAELMQGCERAFYKIMDRMVTEEPIPVQPGAARLLQELLDDADGSGGGENQIAVMTQLPRRLALKVFYLSRELAQVLEGRVPASHLITHPFYDLPPPRSTNDPRSDADAEADAEGDGDEEDEAQEQDDAVPAGAARSGRKFLSQQLLHCAAAMQKPTVLTLLVDGNRNAIVAAKHAGFSCIAVRGFATNAQFLRPADVVVASLDKVRVKDIYNLVKKEIDREAGPEQHTSTEGARARITTKQTAAPAQDRFEKPKDTFADEINADQN